MTREWFDGQLGRMMALRGFPSDSDGYWEVLASMRPDDVERGIGLSLRTRSWFPAPADLLADVVQARPRETWKSSISEPHDGEEFTHHIPNPFGGEGITIRVKRDWKYHCEDCGDSGWFEMWCGDPATLKSGHQLRPCGRKGEHIAHEWVQQCACWNSNPDLIARRERIAAAAAGRTAKDKS